MVKNIATDTIEHRMVNHIKNAVKGIKDQRTNQTGYPGYVSLPVGTADPAVTRTGEFGLYYNSSTGKVRKSYNGGAWADTTI